MLDAKGNAVVTKISSAEIGKLLYKALGDFMSNVAHSSGYLCTENIKFQ